jgi:hypothetical protein
MFIKQILLSKTEQICPCTVTVGDLNTIVLLKEHINKDILVLKDTMDKMDLTEIYRVSHPTAADYTLSQQLMELYPKQITF